MIIKPRESKDDIRAISEHLKDIKSRVDKDRTQEVEKEIKNLWSGFKSEEKSGYLINFYYDNDRYAILHDLRIVYNKEQSEWVAQIDHLVINRALQCFVFETKSIADTLEINDEGEFVRYFEGKPSGMNSPIEQNNRHIDMLEKHINENELIPKRFARKLKVNYRSIVLISSGAIIKRPVILIRR